MEGRSGSNRLRGFRRDVRGTRKRLCPRSALSGEIVLSACRVGRGGLFGLRRVELRTHLAE